MSVSGWWFYVCYFSSQLQFMYLKGEKNEADGSAFTLESSKMQNT